MTDAVVIEALRTPRGAAKDSGALHALTPMELLAGLLRALQQRTGVDTAQVADGVFGCVTQTGEQGGNIGKSACLLADWSPQLSAVTINRYCASGLSAVNFAAQQARDSGMLAVGGGIEMMSRVPMFGDQVPYYTDRALGGRIGFVPPALVVRSGGHARGHDPGGLRPVCGAVPGPRTGGTPARPGTLDGTGDGRPGRGAAGP